MFVAHGQACWAIGHSPFLLSRTGSPRPFLLRKSIHPFTVSVYYPISSILIPSKETGLQASHNEIISIEPKTPVTTEQPRIQVDGEADKRTLECRVTAVHQQNKSDKRAQSDTKQQLFSCSLQAHFRGDCSDGCSFFHLPSFPLAIHFGKLESDLETQRYYIE